MANFFDSVCDCVPDCTKLKTSTWGSIQRLPINSVTASPVGYLYADTPELSPLLLTYVCPCWLMKTQRPCGMSCASADEGKIEGPKCVSCVSPGFWGDLLLTQEWKPQIKVCVLTKDKWDFSFAQTVQDCVGLLKVPGKNVSWSTPLMKHAHEIKVCILLLMFWLYMYKEVGEKRGNI